MCCLMDHIYQFYLVSFLKNHIKHKHYIAGLGKFLDILSNIRLPNSNFREFIEASRCQELWKCKVLLQMFLVIIIDLIAGQKKELRAKYFSP